MPMTDTRTGHERSFEQVVEDLMESDPRVVQTLLQARRLMREGRWEGWYIDQWCQGNRSGLSQFAELYSFLQYHTYTCCGWLLRCTIGVGAEPYADAEMPRNDELLRNLPAPFTAEAWGGKEQEDGLLRWSEPIRCEKLTFVDGKPNVEIVMVDPKPGMAALEIGSTQGSKSWSHLFYETGLARWPYGQKAITLFLLTDDSPMRQYQRKSLESPTASVRNHTLQDLLF